MHRIMKFLRHTFVFLFFASLLVIFGSHTVVQAVSTSASVTIGVVTTSTPADPTPVSTTTLGGSYTPPYDALSPSFIIPRQDQVKQGSFFDFNRFVQFLPVSQSELVIEWYSDEPVSFTVQFGETKEYEKANFSSTLYSDIHSVKLTGLVPGKMYVGNIVITDASGNYTAKLFSFVFPRSIDTEKEVDQEKESEVIKDIEKETIEDKQQETVKEKNEVGAETKKPVTKKPPEQKKKTTFVEDIKGIVTNIFTPTDHSVDKPEEDLPKVDDDLPIEEKNNPDVPGQLPVSSEDESVVFHTPTPASLRIGMSAFSDRIIVAFGGDVSAVRNMVQKIAFPGPRVFVMPSIINRAFSVVEFALSVAYHSLSKEATLCTLIRIDGMLEIIANELFRFSLCE